MKIVLLDADTLGGCDLSEIKSLGDLTIYPTTKLDERLTRCKDAEVIITNKVLLDETLLRELNTLKLICISATGTNNVDIEYATKKGIVVKNAAGYSTSSVAQHTITLALQILSQLDYYDSYCKSAQWCKSETFVHINKGLKEIAGLRWGIIGLGAIGKYVAKIVSAFGAQVSYHSTSGANTQGGYPHLNLPDLLAQSDIISIHSPLNSQTLNLINANNLPLLKKGAILINVGRGGIVNEEDIAMFLQHHEAFYAADVLASEPMIDNHVFLNPSIASKLLITPHVAWAYGDSITRLIKIVAQNIREFYTHN